MFTQNQADIHLPAAAARPSRSLGKRILHSYQLYVLILPTILYLVIFQYWPLYGILLAFKDYQPSLGILGSPWVGIKYFQRFFNSPVFWELIRNTLQLSLYGLAAGFPLPILIALGMNCLKGKYFKKTVQTVTYMPHFISTVVLVGMLTSFLSPSSGIVNNIIAHFGGQRLFFMGVPAYFSHLYVWTGVWQNMGWDSILYLAALSGVDPSLHEAAVVDGASRVSRVWHIDLPGIMPTVIIMLIMSAGHIMGVGFEKAFLMQNTLNQDASEIIATYVYKKGLLDAQYSYSTAVGLFNSVINVILLVTVNQIAKKVGETSLW